MGEEIPVTKPLPSSNTSNTSHALLILFGLIAELSAFLRIGFVYLRDKRLEEEERGFQEERWGRDGKEKIEK